MRADSIIATGISFENADYDFTDNLELKVFALETKAETTVYQAGKEVVKVFFEKEDDKIKGYVTGGAGCRIRLVGCICREAEGVLMEVQGKDTVLALEEDDVAFIVHGLPF